MLNKIQFNSSFNNSFKNPLNNPILRYKLDPDEPGIPYPSKASMSIARVASHELGNIIRFRQKAAREGGIVVNTGIHLNLKVRGSYLAATSGYSEATIIYPDKRRTPSGIIDVSDKVVPKIESDDLTDEELFDDSKLESSILKAESESTVSIESIVNNQNENIDVKIKELEEEERTVSANLADITRRTFIDNDSDSLALEKNRKVDEARKIKQELAFLKMKKELDKQNELLSNYSSEISLANKLIKSSYHLNNNYSTGEFINILI